MPCSLIVACAAVARLSSNVIKHHKRVYSVPFLAVILYRPFPFLITKTNFPFPFPFPFPCFHLGPFIANKRLVICTMILTSRPAALTGAKICKNSIGLLGLTSVLM